MIKSTSKQNKRLGSNRNAENEGDMNSDLHELFLDELADIYNAEQQLIKALPKLAKAARSPELREAFENHLEETQTQISRLEEVVQSIGESLKRKKCKGMEGLLEESSDMM